MHRGVSKASMMFGTAGDIEMFDRPEGQPSIDSHKLHQPARPLSRNQSILCLEEQAEGQDMECYDSGG